MNSHTQHDTAAIMHKISDLVKACSDKARTGLKSGSDLGEIERQVINLSNGISTIIIQNLIQNWLSDSTVIETLQHVGGTRCLQRKGMRPYRLRLGCGATVEIQSPYFISTRKRRGRKKAGPNGTGEHLALTMLGCTGGRSPVLVSRVAQAAILAPSFEVASSLLNEWGIAMSPNSIRRTCQKLGDEGRLNRGSVSIGNNEIIEGYSLVIGIDGGRIRERRRKRGRKPKHLKQQGFHTDWKEPKLMTMYLIDSDGNIVRGFKPLHDATMDNHEGLFQLVTQYLKKLEISKLKKIIFTADGAPWIWQGIEKRLNEWFSTRGFPIENIHQVLDYTHAKQHLNELLNLVPETSREASRKNWKAWLWAGKVDELKQGIKLVIKNKDDQENALKQWKSYFDGNRKRMCYSTFKEQGLVCGSGCVESAIRRVINLRLKAPGSFWLKDMAETFLFLRSQFISGRWSVFISNITYYKTREFLV